MVPEKTATFVDIWRDQTNEELFGKYIAHVGKASEQDEEGSRLAFYKRHSAARILARRKYEPAGEVLLKWLDNPKEGIGDYLSTVEWGTATDPGSKFDYSKDAKPEQIQFLAAESLGLMKYEPARPDLKRLANDEEMRERNPQLSLCFDNALERLDGLETHADKGYELEHDILLFIAATSYINFFRTPLFKGIVNQTFFDDTNYPCNSSTELAERYIEALRKLPNLEIPIAEGRDTLFHPVPKFELVPFLAARMFYPHVIERFEIVCADILSILRESKGLITERGYSHTCSYLPDGTTFTYDNGVLKEIKKYLLVEGGYAPFNNVE